LSRALKAIAWLALLNGYITERIVARWPWAQHHWVVASLAAIAFFGLQLLGPFGDRLLFRGIKKGSAAAALVLVADWTSYLSFGVMSLLLFYGLATDLITVPWKLLAPPADPMAFDLRTLQILGCAVIATSLIGVWQARVRPVVKKIDVPLNALPAGFHGFKIAQISDLHIGPTIGRRHVQNVVDVVNGLQPDLVALTGDFADGSVHDLTDEIAPLAGIRAPHGMFFVTGNHEYFWNALEWMAELTKLGARVLSNEHEVIRRGGDSLIVAGVTDYSTRRMPSVHASNPSKAIAGAPGGAARIVLAHQPASYEMTHAAGFDLQLSGHTHAGQYFPFSLLIRFFQRYYKGLNRHGNMWIYVNSGTGYWGPPLRAGVPSEVTLLTLRPQTV
jgi:hypothetical protein